MHLGKKGVVWAMGAALLLVSAVAVPIAAQAAEPRLRPTEWAQPVISEHLDNWYKVDDRVYRSEQPDAKAMKDIEAMGIGRVLSLREYHSDKGPIGGTHLQSFRIRINTSHITDDEIVQALSIIMASDKPILVHCWHGSDRTGTVIAAYRMVVQGWSKEAAIDELVNGGYHYHSIYDNIITYLNNLDVDAIRKLLSK